MSPLSLTQALNNFTLDALLHWLETCPMTTTFAQKDCEQCLIAQYLSELTEHDVEVDYHTAFDHDAQEELELPWIVARLISLFDAHDFPHIGALHARDLIQFFDDVPVRVFVAA